MNGQIALYRWETCGDAVFLKNNGDFTLNKIVEVGQQPAGHYFIYVSNDDAPNSSDPYTLLIEVR